MSGLFVLKTGRKPASLAGEPGDYEDWIAAGLGLAATEITVVDAQRQALPPAARVGALVITGSAAMVTDRSDWIEASARWLRELVEREVPVLGICFGHQLLGYALGGEVGWNPRGVEVGTVEIALTAEAQLDPLFADMPARFPAHESHRQSVLRLPAGARLLAGSERDPHQAFAFGRRAWGVQFHPEFTARVTPAYIDGFRELLAADGRSPEAIIAASRPTPESAGLLKRFAAFW